MANKKACMAVRRAVIDGDLPHIKTQKCTDCGRQAQHYDHRDYDKPLEVEPTCISCNFKRGPAKGLHDNKKIPEYDFIEFKLVDTDDSEIQVINLISQAMDSQWLHKDERDRVEEWMISKYTKYNNRIEKLLIKINKLSDNSEEG